MSFQEPPSSAVGAVLTAVRTFDQRQIRLTLDDAVEAHGTVLTLEDVVLVSLRLVGLFESSGSMDDSHERALATALTRWLAGRTALLPAPTREGIVLLAAGPEDLGTVTLDTVTLDCLHLLLAEHGVELTNVGAHIPVEALLLVVDAVRPDAVVMISNTPTAAGLAARSVTALVATGYPVYVAGTAFDSQFDQQRNSGILLAQTWSESARLLTSRHTSPSGADVEAPRS